MELHHRTHVTKNGSCFCSGPNPDDEHGYISEAQMLIRLLEHAGRGVPNGVWGYMASPSADPWLREALQRAEGLLEMVRRSREGETGSTYEVSCRARIDALYGRHEKALQTWDNLLARPGVYGPPIRRQVVWAYLARRGRAWDELSAREADRIVELLEQNVREEPERESNLRLWVQAVRRATTAPSVERVIVPHPVSWTQVWATRLGAARTPRGPRVACDRPASRGASTGCSARRTWRRRRARRRDFETPGHRRLAP